MEKTLNAIKALSDRHRVRALLALPGQELCLCNLQDLLGLVPSSVSRHMSILQEAGFVVSRKKGKWTYFSLAPLEGDDPSRSLLRWLLASLEDDPSTLADREIVRQLKKKDSERCN
ncbi:MAG: winged helix-turn-helix transcriptional regulator [Synergistaceae bacterium]|nr:winged helix-turn-helix transcriptional regulator [Synergistaceae bacterium]